MAPLCSPPARTVNSVPVVLSRTVALGSVPSASLELVATAPCMIAVRTGARFIVVHPVVDDCTDQLRRLRHMERVERLGAGDEVRGKMFWWPAKSWYSLRPCNRTRSRREVCVTMDIGRVQNADSDLVILGKAACFRGKCA
jgi:hypothetical protein